MGVLLIPFKKEAKDLMNDARQYIVQIFCSRECHLRK